MTKLLLVRAPAPQTKRAKKPSLEERVSMVGAFVDAGMRKDHKPGGFEAAEEELERQLLELRRDLMAYVDAPVIEFDRRVLRAAQTYMTAAGPVTAERWLYRERDDDSQPAVSSIEPKLGGVDFWSPKAAKQALWLVARMTCSRRSNGGKRPAEVRV